MSSLKKLLSAHLSDYPLCEIRDILKFLYQREFGAEHLLSDEVDTLRNIEAEAALSDENARIDSLGDDFCRAHLGYVKSGMLSVGTFNKLFTMTANEKHGTTENFIKSCKEAVRLCHVDALPFCAFKFDEELQAVIQSDFAPVRHSESFRSAYAPHYRVLKRSLCDIIPILSDIDKLLAERSDLLIAIDGNSASGKSTLARTLAHIYDCDLIHMDDFFLRPEQRTPERLAECGGNIDYERFTEEVLTPLQNGTFKGYTAFDCSIGALGEYKSIGKSRLRIIEGAYSLHSKFQHIFDLKILMRIDRGVQLKRIEKRNGTQMLQRFVNEWIPMEDDYLRQYNIENTADFTLYVEADEKLEIVKN